MAHAFRQIEDSLFTLPPGYENRSEGYRRADLIGQAQGSVHIGFLISELAPGGRVDSAVHFYEKGVFVLEGEVELNRDGKVYRLRKFDYALLPIGTPHAFRNTSGAPARWVEKCAPQPKFSGDWKDSFFIPSAKWPDSAPSGPKDPLTLMVDRFEWDQLPASQNIDKYMWGWAKKMLMDRKFGSQQFDMFIIEFEAGGQTNTHEHPFEEAYLVLEGEGTFTAEGEKYVLKPGTIGWSGVGAPHGFFMDRGTSCRWLEIMTPQPPAQFSNRRHSAWDDIRNALTG